MNTERGGARERNGRFYAYARVGKKKQLEFLVPSAKSKKAAKSRAVIIAKRAEQFARINRTDLIERWAREIAVTDQLDEVEKALDRLLSDPTIIPSTGDISFEAWQELVTSGELAKQHPDRVAVKDYADDKSRLRLYILPIVRDVPMSMFSLDHADLVMTKLPKMSGANRRHVAQIIHRLCTLAVYPGKIIDSNPIPKGWLPKIPKRSKHYSCLFPREEAKLLGNVTIDLEFRLACGVLNREGMRLTELLDSGWPQWGEDEDHCRTFRVEKSKTNDPRDWAVRPDTARAMSIWREMVGKRSPFANVAKIDRTKIAERFRAALKASGVTRAELFDDTDYTGKLRAHDMRATFVTISLAEGKTDTWVRDRTAHKTTSMIDRYRRAARRNAELELGSLHDLVQAIPELREKAPGNNPVGGAGKALASTAKNGTVEGTQASESTEGGTRTLTGKPRRILNTPEGPSRASEAHESRWIETSTDDDRRPSSTHPAPHGQRLSTDTADSKEGSTELPSGELLKQRSSVSVFVDGFRVAMADASELSIDEGPRLGAASKEIAKGLRRAGLPAVAKKKLVHVGGRS